MNATMKATLIICAVLIISLSGCAVTMPPEKVSELVEARDICAEAGGVFRQWQTGFISEITNWECDLSSDPETGKDNE